MLASGLSAPNGNGLIGSIANTGASLLTYQLGQIAKAKQAEGSAVLAALTAALGDNDPLAAALSAGGSEAAIPLIAHTLYGTNDPAQLSSTEKSQLSDIAALIGAGLGGMTGDNAAIASSAAAGRRAVENNSPHVDENGVVIRNIQDGDFNIYQYEYKCTPTDGNNCSNLKNFEELYNSPKEIVGKIMYQDSFTSPESGKSVGIIYFDQDIEPYIYQLNSLASKEGPFTVARKSLPGGIYDIKATYPGHKGKSYHGFLFQGKYITLRDAGNILAGMNAAVLGQAFSDFQKVSGALQQDGKTGVILHTITGKTYGTAPMYGELPYQYYKSKYGYELGLEKIETEKRLKNLIPNKVPTVGELFNAIP